MGLQRADSDNVFAELAAQQEAMVFVHAAWSGASIVSLQVFETWLKDFERSSRQALPPFYRLDKDYPSCDPWLERWGYTDHGYGSVFWIRDGAILDSLPNAGVAGPIILDSKTKRMLSG